MGFSFGDRVTLRNSDDVYRFVAVLPPENKADWTFIDCVLATADGTYIFASTTNLVAVREEFKNHSYYRMANGQLVKVVSVTEHGAIGWRVNEARQITAPWSSTSIYLDGYYTKVA